jgi:hypothetical protein|tara:strand:+ start:8097 stop:8504 length:408 start_codon:yes stop_codon:yes gene_type:complete
MALNSNNQFENFIKGAPLTHSMTTPTPLAHVNPYKYKDDESFANVKNVGAYAGERLCWKQSSNYTSLETNEMRHSKLFFVLTQEILDAPDDFKTNQEDNINNNTFHPGTVLGLTFTGRDTLRYVPSINPEVDKFS